MIQLKSKVKILGIKPELVLTLMLVNQVFLKYNLHMIITSMLDGQHSDGSLHPYGFAVDIRSRNISRDFIQKIVRDLKEMFDEQLDIVLESDHFHIEFDPHLEEFDKNVKNKKQLRVGVSLADSDVISEKKTEETEETEKA